MPNPGGMTHGAEREALEEPSSDLYSSGPFEITYILSCYYNAPQIVASFKNPVLVLTLFWIGSQNFEKYIEKGIFSKD